MSLGGWGEGREGVSTNYIVASTTGLRRTGRNPDSATLRGRGGGGGGRRDEVGGGRGGALLLNHCGSHLVSVKPP